VYIAVQGTSIKKHLRERAIYAMYTIFYTNGVPILDLSNSSLHIKKNKIKKSNIRCKASSDRRRA